MQHHLDRRYEGIFSRRCTRKILSTNQMIEDSACPPEWSMDCERTGQPESHNHRCCVTSHQDMHHNNTRISRRKRNCIGRGDGNGSTASCDHACRYKTRSTGAVEPSPIGDRGRQVLRYISAWESRSTGFPANCLALSPHYQVKDPRTRYNQCATARGIR